MQHDRNYLEDNPPLNVDEFTFDLQRFAADGNWSDNAATSFSSQSGTTITINSAAELALLAKNVNSGNTYEGWTITLGADIDLSGHNWTPIGKDDDNPFKGTFDGNNANYKISNLTVNSGNYVGLFGYNNGTIKDLTLTNVNITGSSRIGGIVGWNYSGGTVSGCTVSGTVTGTGGYVGGLVGYNYSGTVSGNTAIVTISGGKFAGGLVGYTNDKVKDNKFYSNLDAVGNDNSFVGDVTNNTRYYSLTVLEGVTFTVTDGDTIIDGTNTYYASGTTFTLKPTGELKAGYAFSTGNPFTITENTTVTCIPNPANHYVLADDTKTLATADNTTNHPELVQVYALTLQGVTVTGDTVAKDSNGNYYAAGDITVAAKTGYTYSGETTLNVAADRTVSATFDTANHYVFKSGDTYTFATAENVASNNYPDLVQVYELTLEGVTASGDIVATADGKTYAAGEVTLAAKAGYKISGSTTLTVTEDTSITATDVWGVGQDANGTAEKPYLISDVAGLQALADYVNGGGNTSNLNFKLTANINLNGVTFTPIGNFDGDTPDSFEGTFDGGKTYDAQGNCTETYTISNLSISSTGNYVGLFGFVGEGGTIKNVTLENATINGNSSVGGLVGYNYGGSVEKCSVIGGTVTGADKVGELVGYSGGTVKDCSVIGGTVSSNQYVGGLVGHNNGSVSDNTVGNVTVTATYTGDSACCGGLVGYHQYGTVTGNKVSGTVNGDGTLGALVGYNEANDPINDNYYYGNADAVGYQKDSVTVGTNTRLYKLTVPAGVEVSGEKIFTFGGTTYAASGSNVTFAAKPGVVYSTGDSFTITENSFTITEDTTVTAKDFWGVGQGADGTAKNPYLISTVEGLQYLADYVNGGGKDTTGLNFKLNGNIDLTDVDFAPIGYYTDANNNNSFKGTFDGNNSAGYKISNLTVNTPDNNFVGLFGVNDGTIKNVTLTDVNITGKNYVGGLVGQNYGSTVSGNTVSGTVSGKNYVGGLVGSNAFGGKVEDNTAITTVNASGSPVGGVVAANGSIVTGNKFYSNKGAINDTDDTNNTRYYKLTLPEGVTASGNSFTFDGTTYATGTVILLSAKPGYAFSIDVTGDLDLSDITVKDVWGVENGANGLANSPYLISDVTGLQLLAAYVNAGNDCADLNFKLTADIDLSSVENFTAIGNYTNANNYNPFSGTFDGGDFKISNLKINSTLHYNGLFSYVGKDGTIKNVTLDNVDISGNGSLGALVGQNDGTVENCTVSGKVNGKGKFVGGLVGVNNGGTITDGTVNGGTVTGSNNNVGGLVGYNAGTVTGGTVNNVDVTGWNYVGELTGYNTGGTVTGSKVVATVTANTTNNPYVGGVVGQNVKSGTVGTSENPNYYHSDKGAVEGADADNNLPIYELTLPDGVTASGALLTYGNKAYVTAGNVTFTGVKTGYVLDNTSVTVSSDMSISATVDTNGHYVFKDGETYTLATNENVAAAGYPDLTQVYELTLPEGVTVDSGTFATDGNGKYYAAGNVTFAGVKTGYVINDVNVTQDTSISATLDTSDNKHYVLADDTKTLATADNTTDYSDLKRVYALTLPEGVTAEGDIVATADGKTYAAGNVTFTGVKTGYVIDSVNVTEDTTVTATFDTANHYVLADNTSTLATAENVGSYPNLVQVYELTLPSGVTASGDTVITIDGKTYAAGNVTFTGVKTGYVIDSVNVTEDTTVTATFDTANHYVLADDTKTLATADNTTNYPDLKQVYALTLPEGVTADGDIVATADGKTYAAGSVTFTGVKTGYVINGVNVTQDTTVTATVEPTNHYAFNNGNGYTYATNSNVGSYPNLVQVYELTVPDSLKVTGDTVATANGKTYAAGSVTFTAADGYTVTSITVNGETLDGKTFTVNAATEISAESSKSINGGKGVEVGGTTGDLSGNDAVYSITASQQNSTLVGNAKNNTVVLTGGGENILTGGGGNDTYKFESGGGIVTDYGIGATKSGDGTPLPTASGSDIVKVSGKVSGVYFDRDASSKKTPTFTAVVTYGSGDDNDTQIIVLQNISKKPTKYGSNPVYQTNDAAAATLKALFHDDSELSADLLQQVASLGKLDGIGDLNLPAVDALNQNTQATYSGDNG